MNLLGFHFRVRRWFLDLFEPDESEGERFGRLLREYFLSVIGE